MQYKFSIEGSTTDSDREPAGRHAELPARDANGLSEMQKTFVALMRVADMPTGEPTCRVGNPTCKNKIASGRAVHAGLLLKPILMCYYFTLHTQYCRGCCLRLAARDIEQFASPATTSACRLCTILQFHSTHNTHSTGVADVCQPEIKTNVRAATLACRPFTFFQFWISFQRQHCRGRYLGLAERYKQQELHYISGSPVCISGSHPCMSVFHYGTILPQSPNNALPWPMCWRRETQKRSCISGSQPCISARLLACRTNPSPTV